jgi:hypothetical protein
MRVEYLSFPHNLWRDDAVPPDLSAS